MKTIRFYIMLAVMIVGGIRMQAHGQTMECIKTQFRDPFWVDTTSVDFQSIARMWNDYKCSVWEKECRKFYPTNTTENGRTPMSFWMESEVEEFGNPDLLLQSFALSPYDFGQGEELFIGVEKRNDTLFEMRTMLFGDYPTERQLTGVFTIPVIKVSETEFKFYSKLSLLKPTMQSTKIGWVTFYYPSTYHFDAEAANHTVKVANGFAAAIGLEHPKEVEYYLFNDRTEYFRYLGADVSCYDFIGCSRVYPHGFAFADCNKVFCTQGGESMAHEIIHFIIKEKTGRKKATMFEEGVCSYYGGHALQSKETNISELKKWLGDNPQIDLGVSLVSSYKDKDGRFVTDSTTAVSQEKFVYSDFTSNYAYAIQMVVCEMAERKGGKALVITMLREITENDMEYEVIERYLGIKREKVNQAIRKCLQEHY